MVGWWAITELLLLLLCKSTSDKLVNYFESMLKSIYLLLSQTGLLSGSQRNGPGDGGRAVKVPSDREAEAKETFKINQFNLVASDMMALNRTLPDYRMEE